MDSKVRDAGNWIGGVFLGIGIYRFFTGDGWIVWFLLAFLFGGFTFAGQLLKGRDGS